MASYYYLISSLPMLRAGDAPPLDYAAFLDQCRGAVSDRVYRSLEELTVRSEDGGFVSRWAAFYRVLQGELTYQRRVKRGESCAAPNERDAAVTQTVTAAVNAKDPLEGERLLLALEFDRLDELVGLHSFDDCALYGYALKLQLSSGSACSAMTRARPPSTHCSDRSASRYSAYKKTGETKWRK